MLSLYSEASLIYYFCSRVQRKMHFKLINRCFAYKWTCHLSRMLKWQWRYIYFLYFHSLSLSLSHIRDNIVPLALVLPVLFFQWMTTFWYNPANFKIQYLIIIVFLTYVFRWWSNHLKLSAIPNFFWTSWTFWLYWSLSNLCLKGWVFMFIDWALPLYNLF